VGSAIVGGLTGVKWQRTSVKYITRFRSTDARYSMESIGGAGARWHLRRQAASGSEVVGVFASAQDASAAADADAAARPPTPTDPLPSGPVRRSRRA
jgi:hypothetical protein